MTIAEQKKVVDDALAMGYRVKDVTIDNAASRVVFTLEYLRTGDPFGRGLQTEEVEWTCGWPAALYAKERGGL